MMMLCIRSSSFTIVTGIQNTSPQPRLEIRQLEKNADQWNIYLLGMRRFMRTNQTEKLSYYQIAGK
jgi:tyrosinase